MSIKTIREVSELSKISISALRYYDEEGLFGEALPKDEKGQRVFDQAAISRLQQIMLYRELGLGIGEIKNVFKDNTQKSSDILNEQITKLKAQARKYKNLALLAEIARDYGISILDFHLDEEEINQVLNQYKKAAEVDVERIKKMSVTERVTIATRLIGLLEKLRNYRLKGEEQTREEALKQIDQFASLLMSTLDIQSVPLRSMAKGVAGKGMISEMLDNYGGKGFSSYVATLMTEYADKTMQPEIPVDNSTEDYIQMLYSMWA